jgi:CheY-like chemotaxis protein
MRKSICIFDDDEDILFLCNLLLQQMGWEVHARNNCNNILSVLREIKPSVILIDNWLPDTGGIIATQKIKADPDLKNIKVIFFSANNDVKKLAEEANADTWLSKPFDISQFEEVVNRFL